MSLSDSVEVPCFSETSVHVNPNKPGEEFDTDMNMDFIILCEHLDIFELGNVNTTFNNFLIMYSTMRDT